MADAHPESTPVITPATPPPPHRHLFVPGVTRAEFHARRLIEKATSR